ncbi:hypothetical protein [Bradyrhizobium sp. WSM3983]|uniref:hypothetical protein n=1 Tax=Bradyrhizobium sp. WSM3983 TaxID=1038867 RepID=UPI0012EB0788|nr:hypothetical protein [Bradyrhizobium sp. WSM3983]
MATIVLVHGINQQFESADQLEAAWRPAIAGGVREAGGAQLADAILRGELSMRMAFYGGRFRLRAQGGGSQLSEFEGDPLAEAIAKEWLNRATQSDRENVRLVAERELGAMSAHEAGQQGTGSLIRSAIAALSQVPLLADTGLAFASSFLWSALDQVTSYFKKPELRDSIIRDVLSLVTTETRVIIGHPPARDGRDERECR